MKWKILLGIMFVLIMMFLLSGQISTKQSVELSSEKPEEKRLSGADRQRVFFAEWHQPYGAVLDREMEASIQAEIARLPKESPDKDVNSWIQVGPSGMQTPGGALYSGRVLDIDALNGPGTTVGAASGGLWQYQSIFPVPLTDEVTSQWIGTFAYDPDDENTILMGTGEFWIHGGTGLWKSTDGGDTWVHKTMNPEPSSFFRIRYGSDGNTVHAATRSGYYRSTDDGETWTNIQFTGSVTDLAIVPGYVGGPPDVLYMTRWGEGLYLSLDAGLSWYLAANATMPSEDIARGSVAVSASNPGIIYVAFTKTEVIIEGDDVYYEYPMLGIWKTTNYGYNWVNVSPPDNYMGRQGWYNNVISICPTNPNLIYAGGVALLRSQNGGSTWEIVNDSHLHVDYHAMQWHPNGLYFWVGHDGGWSFSNDRGMDGTWTSSTNYLPITQYTEFDARGVSWASAVVCGGSQDNGISVTQNGGSSWYFRQGGDGGGIQIGPDHMQQFYFALGYSSGDIAFPRYYTEDAAQTKVPLNDGLEPSDTWYPAMRMNNDGTMFTHGDGIAYSRSTSDLTWQPENAYPFSGGITELTVSPVGGTPCIYICLNRDYPYQLYCKDDDWWHTRATGLPAGQRVRKVVPHPTDRNKAYALINGLGSPGQKLYYTANRGLNWSNITGDLPNVPLADLVVHPDNNSRLFLASEYGFYRSINGGTNWTRWNNGCPAAVVATELKTLDMRTFNQGYHIVAATYGRSIWRRDISGDDPTSVSGDVPGSSFVTVSKAVPNPFNPNTTIHFELEQSAQVSVNIFDTSGRWVRRLLSETMTSGPQRVAWDGQDSQGRSLSSGTYLVRVQAGPEVASYKLTLAK